MDYRYIPFYMQGNSVAGMYTPNMGNRDLDYVKEMYPVAFSKIQEQVEKECDGQEFAGSMMFDEYPDKLSLHRVVNNIFEEIKKQEKDCKKDCIKYPDNQWLKDVILVLLLNEMCRRRDKKRKMFRIYNKRW